MNFKSHYYIFISVFLLICSLKVFSTSELHKSHSICYIIFKNIKIMTLLVAYLINDRTSRLTNLVQMEHRKTKVFIVKERRKNAGIRLLNYTKIG